MKIKIFAPAKINLFLKIRNKRKNSYYNLQTVFHSIGLFDIITLKRIQKGIDFTSSGIKCPGLSSNIVVKAARILKKWNNVQKGVHIHLHKSIPVGRGLGGGSSDAASVLLGLNTLWGLKIDRKELIGIAKKLGADVPFFITGYTCAQATGTGDILTPIKAGCSIWYILLDPGINISTKKIFQEWDKQKKKVHIRGNLSDISSAVSNGDFKSICRLMGNDFLFYIHTNRIIYNAYNYFKLQISNVSITGSGSCLFTICNNKQQALKILKKIKKQSLYKTYLVKGLEDSR
ncbi:4-(cytidine 5'-diphospho)-2-C-methyl-D-erythritol kinase [bacterium Unc6]|nr:4-(cytidine 5'-diphospho)-2-C-methyl-D-erythritol kinase [bacterium Unc6]